MNIKVLGIKNSITSQDAKGTGFFDSDIAVKSFILLEYLQKFKDDSLNIKVFGCKTQTINQLKTMKTIILNPEETLRLDYEHNWKELVSFEDYLSIINQRKQFRLNERGIETNKDKK